MSVFGHAAWQDHRRRPVQSARLLDAAMHDIRFEPACVRGLGGEKLQMTASTSVPTRTYQPGAGLLLLSLSQRKSQRRYPASAGGEKGSPDTSFRACFCFLINSLSKRIAPTIV